MIVLLDCCRQSDTDYTFRARSVPGGAATAASKPPTMNGRVDFNSGIPRSTEFLVAFATDPGTLALETDDINHGFFTQSLLVHFRAHGGATPMTRLLTAVRADVMRATAAKIAEIRETRGEAAVEGYCAYGQRPWVNECLTKDVMLRPTVRLWMTCYAFPSILHHNRLFLCSG